MSTSTQNKTHKIKRIAHITREFGSVAGVGGIKDVTWGLCRATAESGILTDVFLPHYKIVDDYLARHDMKIDLLCSFVTTMNYGAYIREEAVSVSTCKMTPYLTLYLLKADPFRILAEIPEKKIPRFGIYQYTKAEALSLGNPKMEGDGYADAFAQNVLLVKATCETLRHVSWRPDLMHCHDGHAALFPLIAQCSAEVTLPYLAHLPSLLTIHNAGIGYHQETFGFDYAQNICGIHEKTAESVLAKCTLDGAFDPLLAGAIYGTAVNTVSENYARELCETGLDAKTAWLGHTYAGLGIDLIGITNGIELDSHDPSNAADLGLPMAFSPKDEDWAGKEDCKQQSIEQLKTFKQTAKLKKYGHLASSPESPLFTFVGRLTEQKGFDHLYEAINTLFAKDKKIQLWGLGNGNPQIVDSFKRLAKKYDGRVCFIEGFSASDANRIYASGDFFLIPSQFEPCGLTDFIAQLNGNIPIVHRVGGLVKTIDNKFGFSYLGGADELQQCIKRALKAYRTPGKKRLRTIQLKAYQNIVRNFTWENVLKKKYLPLYKKILKKAEAILPY